MAAVSVICAQPYVISGMVGKRGEVSITFEMDLSLLKNQCDH